MASVGRLVEYAPSRVGMTEFKLSLAPRSQMKSSFLPFSPMLPSARARFMTNGMSTSVATAAARPAFAPVPRNERRVIMLIWLFCIRLLLLESLGRHEERNHPTHARVVGRRRVHQRAERRRR